MEEEGTDPCQGGQESILPQKRYASCYSLISMCQKSISQTLCIYRRGLEVITQNNKLCLFEHICIRVNFNRVYMHIFKIILGENSENKSIIVRFKTTEQLLINLFSSNQILKIFYHCKIHP